MLQHSSSTWHNEMKYFHSGRGPQGSLNLSLAWFQQGHNVSASSYKNLFSTAYSKLGNSATIPTGFYKL
jgi:hypothetical protein